jgi:hypothetical protein
MNTHEKLCCLFADIWDMFVTGSDLDCFDLQTIIQRHGLGIDYTVTKDDIDEFTDLDVGDNAVVLSKEAKEIMKVAKQCLTPKK